MAYSRLTKQKGQSLIELLLTIGLAAILLPAVMSGFLAARNGRAQEIKRLEAIGLLNEAKSAMQVIRDSGWQNVKNNGTYHPQISLNTWTLSAGSENVNNFNRSITISDVNENSVVDPALKKIDYQVSWNGSVNGSLKASEYLSRYMNNGVLTHTSQTDFTAGSRENTEITDSAGGEVILSSATVSAVLSDDFTNPNDYIFDANKIEISGGFAQLKNNGGSISGQTTNPGFNTNAAGWTFAAFNNLISQTGNYISSGGVPGGFVNINFPRTSNKISGGYWYQGFTTSTANPVSNLAFNWRVTAYPTATTSLRLYAWLDTNPTGAPVNIVWDSGNLNAATAWSGTVNVNPAAHITSPGTYYLKIGAIINISPGNKGPYTVGFDNVLLTWSGTGSNYASDSPSVYSKSSLLPTNLISWTGFTTTEITNGGSIAYQLSDDDGVTWKYWNGSWTTASQNSDRNDAITINSHIGSFPITNGKIKLKAYLTSNGSQFVRLDKVTFSYTGTGSAGPNTGTYVSPAFDQGQEVAFHRIFWTETGTANTTTKLQIAVNSDNSVWNFVGPDSTAATYFTGNSGTIPLNKASARYLKYKIYLTSSNTDIPAVTEVNLNYSP